MAKGRRPHRAGFGGTTDSRNYTSEDMRFTIRPDTLYAFIMAWPESRTAVIKSLAANSPQIDGRKVADVSLLGYGGKLEWSQTADALTVNLPDKAQQPRRHLANHRPAWMKAGKGSDGRAMKQ